MLSEILVGTPPAIPAPFNLAEHVLAAGAQTPEKIALQILRPTGAERWSYGRLIGALRGIATGLLARGLVPGDRVLLRLGNGVEFPLAFLGAIAAGLVPVPTSAQLTRPEITAMARGLDPALVIAGPDIALPDHPAPVLAASALAGFARLAPAPWHRGAPERPGYIVYTSGTSGQPRAVVHAHRAILARAMMFAGWEGLQPDDRILHAGAFNWTYTLGTGLLDPWTLGATALIPAAGLVPEQLPLLLRRFDATIFAAAPGVYRQMLKQPPPALPRLRHGLSAGESLSPALRDAWAAATGLPIYEAFGLSECSTFVSGAPARPAPEGAVGYPQPGRHLALLDGQGQVVARGQPGILAVHRSDPGLFLHYLGAPDETAQRFVGPWFLTGDQMVMRPDGALVSLGRDDDMMNAGGFRVSPLEVEAALSAHPAIADLAAVELPLRPGVSIIAAFYVPRSPDSPPDTADLNAFAAQCLARYKQPRLWIARPDLARNANGKLNRRALRAAWDNMKNERQANDKA